MPSTYNNALRLEEIANGEQSGQWGTTTNKNLAELLVQAITGTTSISVTGGNVTLTSLDGVVDQSRNAVLVVTGTPGTTRVLTIPNVTKLYTVKNETANIVQVKTASGVAFDCPPLSQSFINCNGVNVVTGRSITDGANTITSNAAPFDSPAFSGTPTAPTASVGTNTTQLATTAFVNAEIANDTSTLAPKASPTFTGTVTVADLTASGNIVGNGNWTIGNADTDTVTIGSSFVTGSVLRSAKVAANTLALAAYDVDGAAYTNLVTLTASNTPTLALTSTGVGSINNMSIGATTASTVVATQVDITAQGDLRLQDTTGGQYVALQAPGTIATSYTLTLPTDDGTAGQALVTDGSGVLSWATPTVATNVTITTSTTASAFKVPFADTTVSTSGNYGLLQDSTATFTYNPSTNTLTAGTFAGDLSGNAATATNSTQLGSVAAASYAQLGTTQTFTGDKTFTGLITSDAYNMDAFVSMFGSTSDIQFSVGTSSVNICMTINSSGNLTISGNTAVKSAGTAWANPSDARLKNNVVSYTRGLNELVQIQPKSFTFNGKAGSVAGLSTVGIIADEIEQVLPSTVQKRWDKLNPDDAQQTEIKYFDASELTWVMVNAIKELKNELDSLKTQLATFKNQG